MFNLIISIIAIALVVVLAGASLYYGGDAFNQGSTDAQASTFINQAQQIQAAVALRSATTGADTTDLADLETDFLTSIPSAPAGAWTYDVDGSGNGFAVAAAEFSANAESGLTVAVCERINENGSNVVSCVESAGTAGSPSTDAEVEAALDGDVDVTASTTATHAVVRIAL